MSDEDEQYQRKLLDLLNESQSFEAYMADVPAWRVEDHSSLAADDQRIHPYELSHAVRHSLVVAIDHLRGLRQQMVTGPVPQERRKRRRMHVQLGLAPYAPLTMARGAIENAAKAVWMISPPGRLDRVKRRIGVRAGELDNAHQLHKTIGVDPKIPLEQRRQELLDLLTQAGVPEHEATEFVKKPPKHRRIVREAGESTPLGRDLVILWSMCSAVAHGELTATLGLLEREVIRRENGVVLARVTGQWSLVFWAALAARDLIARGLNLYQERARRYVAGWMGWGGARSTAPW